MIKYDFKYLIEINSKGKKYYYYRRNKYRHRIKAKFGTAEFAQEYYEIHNGFDGNSRHDIIPLSIKDLIVRYKKSNEYSNLKCNTKKEYDRYLDFMMDNYAKKPCISLPRKAVIEIRDKYFQTNSSKNKFIAILKTLMNYAILLDWRPDNPCNQIKKLELGDGARPWQEHEIEQFRNSGINGGVLLAFEIGVATGARISDVLKMAWSNCTAPHLSSS